MSATAAVILASLLSWSGTTQAYDINDRLSLSGVVAGVVQCIDLNVHSAWKDDDCQGTLVAQPEVLFKLSDRDELFMKVGVAGGNGLNNISPFVLAPFAADLEDDLRDINGRSRDHILTLWYKRMFMLGPKTSLAITAGIIDSTDYLDDNAFANDEFNQFLNEVFVNAPIANLPSYDLGSAVEFKSGPFSARGVIMKVGKNDDGLGYTFYGGQLAYTVKSALGEGTYRVVLTGTTDHSFNAAGTGKSNLLAVVFGFDQMIGPDVGVFLRVGWQDDGAPVDYGALYSLGINIRGRTWGRPDDKIGIGYAYLDGGNGDIVRTHAIEAYYRFAVTKHVALTADVQYLRDDFIVAPDPDGFIFGLRTTKEF